MFGTNTVRNKLCVLKSILAGRQDFLFLKLYQIEKLHSDCLWIN